MSTNLRILLSIGMLGVTASAFAGWEYHEQLDAFEDTDRSTVTASVDLYENFDVELVIGASCQYDGLNIMLSHKYLGGDSDDQVRVQLRVDKNESYGPAYWDLGSNSRISWMPMRDVPNMIAQMKAGYRLLIRVVDPLDGETLTQAVSLVGFSAAVESLSCYRR